MAEKEINEISRDARVLFTKANEAAQRENLDYAIALFNQVLEKEPGFFECRKALREAQFRKAGGGGGFFKKMLSGAGSSPQVAKAKMAMSKNPGRGARHRRADFERRPEQFRRAPPHRRGGAGAGTAAHGRVVARNPGEEFAQGQEPGDRICRRPLRQRRRHPAAGNKS